MAKIVPIFPSTFQRTSGTAIGREALQLCTTGAQKCADWLHELTPAEQ